MAGTTRAGRLVALTIAGIAAAVALGGASDVRAGYAHPCGPGETDVIGQIDDVWYCDVRDQNEPPPPSPPPAPGTVGAKPVVKGHDPIVADGPSLAFDAVAPVRVLDTRTSGASAAPGVTTRVDLTAAVPGGSKAVAVNITAADPAAAGYLSAWNCAGDPPPTSAVNFGALVTASSNTIVQLDATGGFCIATSAPTHVIVDLNGVYSTTGGSTFVRLPPSRIHDSRPTPIPAGTTTRIALPSTSGPTTAAFVNLTAVGPAAAGYLTAWPCSLAQPNVSNLNFPAGISAIANAAQVPVGSSNELCVYNSATMGLLVDLLGVYDAAPDGLRYQPTHPVRILDTRDGTGGFVGTIGNKQRLYVFMPFEPMTIVGTITAVDPPQDGYLVVWGGSGQAPPVSNINAARTTVANMFTSFVQGGYLYVAAGPTGGEHVLVDVTGTFVTATG